MATDNNSPCFCRTAPWASCTYSKVPPPNTIFFPFSAVEFVPLHKRREDVTKLGGVKKKTASRPWGALFLVSMQKGGARGAEAGNHPQGRGWGSAGMLGNKVRVTFWCQCHLFRARSSLISDRNRWRLRRCWRDSSREEKSQRLQQRPQENNVDPV